jgi:IS5 family transposase
VERKHKLVRRYHVSNAALHDSQAGDHLLMQGNTGACVWADPAYGSEEMESRLRAYKLKSHIHHKGTRGKPLTGLAKGSNRRKFSVRAGRAGLRRADQQHGRYAGAHNRHSPGQG